MQLETEHKLSQKDRILSALRRAGSHGILNAELNRISFRYSARIFDLRREGHDIRQAYVKRGLYRIWLEPQADTMED